MPAAIDSSWTQAEPWLAIAVAARRLGIGDAIIGMTIVAIGTSLPELASSAVAAARGQPEIAVGNVVGNFVGNNIFIVGAGLGFAARRQPFAIDVRALGGLMIATLVSAIALVVTLRARGGVSRTCGAVCVGSYTAYLVWEVTRGQGG